MVSERFEILNEKEETLHGVIETDKPRSKQPIAIILNGFLDVMDSPQKKLLSELFRDKGYVVVRFDYTYGFGEGSGDVSKFTLTHVVEDITRVIDHATRRGYTNPDKIVLIGHCFGAMCAIFLAAFEERVKAVIGISVPYWFDNTGVTKFEDRELSRMKLKRYFHLHTQAQGEEIRVDYTFIEDGLKKDMARAVRNLEQPLLLIHGAKDESIPIANAQEIYDRTPGVKEIEIIEGMGHDPDTREIKKIFEFIKIFLKKNLQ